MVQQQGRRACLDSKGGNDAPGPDQVVLAQVVQRLIQDDSSRLEPHWLLELDALELLQVLHIYQAAAYNLYEGFLRRRSV